MTHWKQTDHRRSGVYLYAMTLAVTACASTRNDSATTSVAGASSAAAGIGGMPQGGAGVTSGGRATSIGSGGFAAPASGGQASSGGTPSFGGTSGGLGPGSPSAGSSASGANAGEASAGGRLEGNGGTNQAGSASSGASSGGASGGDADAMGGSAGARSSCTASTLMKGDSTRTLQVGTTSRTYILHVPASYTGTTPVPLVLDFHGLGGSGRQQQSSSGYQQLADREGFLIAFPDGIDNAWNIGPCCTSSRDVDDLGFAKAMVAAISLDGCVDPKRVYATGFSMGGGMSQYLACNAADLFAAAAPSSFDLLVPDEEPCEPSRPISVLAFRGTADTVVPYAGGKGSSGRITFLGAQASLQRWVGIDGCTQAMTTEGDCTYYEQCNGGAEVGLCVKQGGSHAPGDANVGWAFLSKFSLP